MSTRAFTAALTGGKYFPVKERLQQFVEIIEIISKNFLSPKIFF
jgi:hypothetical protein